MAKKIITKAHKESVDNLVKAVIKHVKQEPYLLKSNNDKQQ